MSKNCNGLIGREAHLAMGGRLDASSVIVVDTDGTATERFQVGHQTDLDAEVALDLLENPGIRIRTGLGKEIV